MGGWQLLGPTYTFQNIPGNIPCRCTGFSGQVDEWLEALLLQKETKILVLSELPQELQDRMLQYHIGDMFAYTIEKHKFTDEELEQQRKDFMESLLARRNTIYDNITYQTSTSNDLITKSEYVDEPFADGLLDLQYTQIMLDRM